MKQITLTLLLGAVCLLPPAASAAELGRLFLSPAERAALDRARHAAPVAVVPLPVEEPMLEMTVQDNIDTPALMMVEPVRVNGYVQRSEGPPTVWINGADTYQGDLTAHGVDARGVRIEDKGVRVPLTEMSEDLMLKPGQSFDPFAEQMADAYEQHPERELPQP